MELECTVCVCIFAKLAVKTNTERVAREIPLGHKGQASTLMVRLLPALSRGTGGKKLSVADSAPNSAARTLRRARLLGLEAVGGPTTKILQRLCRARGNRISQSCLRVCRTRRHRILQSCLRVCRTRRHRISQSCLRVCRTGCSLIEKGP